MTNFYQPDMQAYLNRYYIFFNVVVFLDWSQHMADQTLDVALNQLWICIFLYCFWLLYDIYSIDNIKMRRGTRVLILFSIQQKKKKFDNDAFTTNDLYNHLAYKERRKKHLGDHQARIHLRIRTISWVTLTSIYSSFQNLFATAELTDH